MSLSAFLWLSCTSNCMLPGCISASFGLVSGDSIQYLEGTCFPFLKRLSVDLLQAFGNSDFCFHVSRGATVRQDGAAGISGIQKHPLFEVVTSVMQLACVQPAGRVMYLGLELPNAFCLCCYLLYVTVDERNKSGNQHVCWTTCYLNYFKRRCVELNHSEVNFFYIAKNTVVRTSLAYQCPVKFSTWLILAKSNFDKDS